MLKKIGLEMQLPEGKLPGFYAQIIKGLAECVRLFDRDKEMLIVQNTEERERAQRFLESYKVASEALELIHLPSEAVLTSLFTDYGFTSRAGYHYVYDHQAAVFHIDLSDRDSGEVEQAKAQMSEYWIAHFAQEQTILYVVDRNLKELMERIAAAYGCKLHFID